MEINNLSKINSQENEMNALNVGSQQHFSSNSDLLSCVDSETCRAASYSNISYPLYFLPSFPYHHRNYKNERVPSQFCQNLSIQYSDQKTPSKYDLENISELNDDDKTPRLDTSASTVHELKGSPQNFARPEEPNALQNSAFPNYVVNGCYYYPPPPNIPIPYQIPFVYADQQAGPRINYPAAWQPVLFAAPNGRQEIAFKTQSDDLARDAGAHPGSNDENSAQTPTYQTPPCRTLTLQTPNYERAVAESGADGTALPIGEGCYEGRRPEGVCNLGNKVEQTDSASFVYDQSFGSLLEIDGSIDGNTFQENVFLNESEMPNLEFPLIYITKTGLLCIRLRMNVIVEMTLDAALRIVDLRNNTVITTSNTGNEVGVQHKCVLVQQERTNVRVSLKSGREIIMHTGEILFNCQTNLKTVYSVRDDGVLTWRPDIVLCRVAPMESTNIIYLNSIFGTHLSEAYRDLASKAYYKFYNSGSVTLHVNNVRIHQTRIGNVHVSAGKKQIRLSTNQATVRVITHFVDMNVAPDGTVRLKRGGHKVLSTVDHLILANDKMEFGFDPNNRLFFQPHEAHKQTIICEGCSLLQHLSQRSSISLLSSPPRQPTPDPGKNPLLPKKATLAHYRKAVKNTFGPPRDSIGCCNNQVGSLVDRDSPLDNRFVGPLDNRVGPLDNRIGAAGNRLLPFVRVVDGKGNKVGLREGAMGTSDCLVANEEGMIAVEGQKNWYPRITVSAGGVNGRRGAVKRTGI